jgi:hypothetical protein
MDGAYAVVQVGSGTYRFRSSPVPSVFVASTTSSSAGVWEEAVIIAAIVLAVVGVAVWLWRRRPAGVGG